MRKQIKFTFQIGYPVKNSLFEAKIIRAASRICGGCTTSSKVGWWCDDGDERKDRFNATAMREHCFELELTCEPAKAESAYSEMREAIATAAYAFGVNTNWVHVTETEMTGRHFSVQDTLAARFAIAAE
jgi:hypothetical protein